MKAASRYTRAVCVGLAAWALAGCSPPAATCQFEKIADLPVVIIHRQPTVIVRIKGEDVRMLVDSGAQNSLLTPATYNTLNLIGSINTNGSYGQGVGGNMQINTLVVEDINIGEARLKNQILGVVDFHHTQLDGPPYIGGLLGFDILQSFDVAFDLPDHRIELYLTPGCTPQQTPWTGDFAVVPYLPEQNHIVTPYIPIQIDGQTFTVLLDSGAAFSLVREPSLAAQGVRPEAVPSLVHTGAGVGDLPFSYRREPFAEVAIGAEDVSNMWFGVTDRSLADPTLDGLLGDDYLARHRVFLVNGARTAYLGSGPINPLDAAR